MPLIEFNSTVPNFTDPNVTYPIAQFGGGPSIDTSLEPVFRNAYEYEYFTFVLWRLCELSQVAIWTLGYRQMASHIRPLCFEFLNRPLSEPYGAGNPIPERAPLMPDILTDSLPFQTNQRKENFLELAVHRPCHRFVDDLDNAYYYNKPLPRLQKETRKIGLGALQLERAWQSILFFASIFSNLVLLEKLQPSASFVKKVQIARAHPAQRQHTPLQHDCWKPFKKMKISLSRVLKRVIFIQAVTVRPAKKKFDYADFKSLSLKKVIFGLSAIKATPWTYTVFVKSA